MAKKLSLQRKNFSKDYVETNGSATEAALRNYKVKNRHSAAQIGYNNLKNPLVIREIESIMESKDITGDFLVEKLKEGLDSTYLSSYKGEVSQTDFPDQYARFKFLDMALKLKNAYPPLQVDQRNLNIDIEIEKMTKEDLSKLLQGLLKEIKDELIQKVKHNEGRESGVLAGAGKES